MNFYWPKLRSMTNFLSYECFNCSHFLFFLIPYRHSELLGQFRESDLGCNTLDSMKT